MLFLTDHTVSMILKKANQSSSCTSDQFKHSMLVAEYLGHSYQFIQNREDDGYVRHQTLQMLINMNSNSIFRYFSSRFCSFLTIQLFVHKIWYQIKNNLILL